MLSSNYYSNIMISLNRPPTITRRSLVASVRKPDSKQLVDTDQLRTQLEQLHAEADLTRCKASNARLRLMRLTEAAENLQQRAATNVLVGKENEARELLRQKKKLMQALEKSKNRIELYDKLSAKINEAISLKETQLIGNVTLSPKFGEEELGHEIRIISPKDNIKENSNKTDVADHDCTESGENQELETQREASLPVDYKEQISEEAESFDTSSVDGIVNNSRGVSSYEDFLEIIDGQLGQVEADLEMFLRFSTLILDGEEKQVNTKVRQTSEIMEDLRNTRRRIASIVKAERKDG